MELCQKDPYPMQYEATWTSSDGLVYEGTVIWGNENEWFFRGLHKQYGNSKGIDINSNETDQVPKANGVGWAQRMCGLTYIHPDVARASGIPSLRRWGEANQEVKSQKMHREGGSRRHKSKQRKSRKSNQSKKRKSRKNNRRRR